jgi:fatty acid desaturase
VREARLYLAAYALLAIGTVATQSALPLLLWIGPVVLGQPVLRYALLAEHTGCPFNNDAYTNTRTTLAGPLVRLVYWNMNYYAAHHIAPSVPFHALPALHEEVKRSLCQIDASHGIAHKGIRAGLAA